MPLRDDVAERAQARIGSVLKGKWHLDRVLGVGGMATVYAATHRNGNRVAIKMLHPEVALDAEVTQRFLREGYVANRVDHPGSVTVLDDDVTDDGAPFLVMELLLGETLETRWLRKGERLTVDEVLPITEHLLEVLAAAHDAGIIHRDLKPENLFLTQDGKIKVLDFGIARLRELSHMSAATTRVGSVLGTPAFMAPEQARGRWDDVDVRTDIWGVGATLFTLLSGRYVHEAETIQEQLILSATTPAPSIAKVAPELSPGVVDLVDGALVFDKNGRFSDARSMLRQVRKALSSEDLSAPPSVPRPSVSRPTSESATLLAPPEVVSAITGRTGTLSTDRVMMSSAVSDSRTARRGLAWRISVGAGFVTSLVVAAVLVVVHGRAEAPPAPSQAAEQPSASVTLVDPQVEDTAPPATASSLVASPVPAPTVTPSAAPAEHKPVVRKPEHEPHVSTAVPRPKPPLERKPPTTTQNPFDRRN
jgi:eukaryotic-like serine/threonine-protein kinase